MGSTIYVTEPEAIDLSEVKKNFSGTETTVTSGSVSFEGSMNKPYDTLIIRSATRIDKHLRQYFPNVNSVIRIGVGVDNIDMKYCKIEGISVFNAPGANADAVSEYVVAMILYSLRRLNKLDKESIKNWDRFAFKGSSIREHTVGIVGFGHVGKSLYKKLDAFSVSKFLVHDPYISIDDIKQDDILLVSLEDLLKQATIISLHLPLTDATTNLINEQRLSLIQSGSLLINAARGGIVDEDAVIARISRNRFTYIADTVIGEPDVSEILLKCKNVILTPHIASLTTLSEKEMIRRAIRNFLGDKKVEEF